jgi:hypothetical protein
MVFILNIKAVQFNLRATLNLRNSDLEIKRIVGREEYACETLDKALSGK